MGKGCRPTHKHSAAVRTWTPVHTQVIRDDLGMDMVTWLCFWVTHQELNRTRSASAPICHLMGMVYFETLLPTCRGLFGISLLSVLQQSSCFDF